MTEKPNNNKQPFASRSYDTFTIYEYISMKYATAVIEYKLKAKINLQNCAACTQSMSIYSQKWNDTYDQTNS